MNRTLTKFIIFTAGAAIGSVVTWKVLDEKYKRFAQEEIESVREYYSSKKEKTEEGSSEEKEETDSDIRDYIKKVNDLGYTNYAGINKEPKEEVKDVERPYVISPDEVGELDDYELIGLVYYADKVLTDDYDEPVEDVESTVGVESLNHFGEYEDDTVYVRNDKLKCEYEICLDVRKYSDVCGV